MKILVLGAGVFGCNLAKNIVLVGNNVRAEEFAAMLPKKT